MTRNLQIANHVVFVSPLVAKTQYEYDSVMAQAAGRAFRHGQNRDVQVYHFLVANTLEVNILEQWTGKLVVERDGEILLVPREQVRALDRQGFAGEGLDGGGKASPSGDGDGDGADEE